MPSWQSIEGSIDFSVQACALGSREYTLAVSSRQLFFKFQRDAYPIFN
jgi:hypothetical protein